MGRSQAMVIAVVTLVFAGMLFWQHQIAVTTSQALRTRGLQVWGEGLRVEARRDHRRRVGETTLTMTVAYAGPSGARHEAVLTVRRPETAKLMAGDTVILRTLPDVPGAVGLEPGRVAAAGRSGLPRRCRLGCWDASFWFWRSGSLPSPKKVDSEKIAWLGFYPQERLRAGDPALRLWWSLEWPINPIITATCGPLF